MSYCDDMTVKLVIGLREEDWSALVDWGLESMRPLDMHAAYLLHCALVQTGRLEATGEDECNLTKALTGSGNAPDGLTAAKKLGESHEQRKLSER